MLPFVLKGYQLLPESDHEKVGQVRAHEHTKKGSWFMLLTILAASVALNILSLCYIFIIKHESSPSQSLSKFASLPIEYISYETGSGYYADENETIADAQWDTLDTNPGAVALSDEFAKEHDVTIAARFPWDESRGLYYVKGFHELHCIKLIRRSISEYRRDVSQTVPKGHINHCLNTLRQTVMCTAADDPLPTIEDEVESTGNGELMRCRSWEKLTAWATHPERNACFQVIDEYKPIQHNIERFAFCSESSPYYSRMKEYFDVYGHVDPWN